MTIGLQEEGSANLLSTRPLSPVCFTGSVLGALLRTIGGTGVRFSPVSLVTGAVLPLV